MEGKKQGVVLKYFKVRGRAEFIRLVLEEGGVPYSQELHEGKDWPSIKEQGISSGEFAFGQVPFLSWHGKPLVQSLAVVNFVGRKTNLYPSDTDAAFDVDCIIGFIEDVGKAYGKAAYAPSEEEFKKQKEAFTSTVLPVALQNASKWLGEKQFFAGAGLSVADLGMFHLLNLCLGVDANCLNAHPNLKKFRVSILNRPRIQAYIKSDRLPKFQNGMTAWIDSEKFPPAANYLQA